MGEVVLDTIFVVLRDDQEGAEVSVVDDLWSDGMRSGEWCMPFRRV